MVLFADFNCPYSYALCERILAVGARLRWQGVEHAPDLPIPAMAPPDLDALEREITEVKSLATEVRLTQPSVLPNTARALAIAASADRLHAAAGAGFRTRVFRALWIDGRDISDPDELRDIARQSGLPARFANEPHVWSGDRSPVGGVPAIVSDQGPVLKGLVSTVDLKEFLTGTTSHDVQGAW